MPESQFRAVLWDLDGTIVDTHEMIYRCIAHTLRKHASIGYSQQDWHAHFGAPLHIVFGHVYQGLGRPAPVGEELAGMVATFREMQWQMLPDVALFGGVLEVIDAITEMGRLQGVVTTKHGISAHRTLDHLALAGRFDVVVCGDDCRNYKPHPEPFMTACSRLNLAPSECVVIGDSPADITGAKAAGLHAVAATWGSASIDATLAAGPDSVAPEPRQLFALLGLGERN
jgi:pyrophosphatase PpaX